jgi:hypothetical protein
MGATADARYEFTVDGPVAEAVVGWLRARFGDVSVCPGQRMLVVVGHLDQAGVRAVLTLLWDAGHDVVAMTAT